MKLKQILSTFLCSILLITAVQEVGIVSVNAAQTTLTENKIGTEDGYSYELWKDSGNTTMTLGSGGTFSCEWSNINNALFRRGIKLDSTQTYSQLGNITVDYSCDYNPSGNSYMCVYGWSVDPLVEYYIVDSWGTWRPPGSTSKGTITVDGGTYDVYETTRTNQPSIQGTATFKQYWSVRTTKRTSGTISVDEHFKAWEQYGMTLGKLYEVALTVEGYQSSGSANVTKNVLTIGSDNSGNNSQSGSSNDSQTNDSDNSQSGGSNNNSQPGNSNNDSNNNSQPGDSNNNSSSDSSDNNWQNDNANNNANSQDDVDISWIDPSKKVVAFTFDDGPVGTASTSSSQRILDVMEKYNMHCTFFYIGNKINDSTIQEIERANSLGCEIGNHSFTHADLTTLSQDDIKSEISKTNEILSQITGKSSTLVRAPYGSVNANVLSAANAPLINWSVDSGDWNNGSYESVLSALRSKIKDGSIVLMHETYDYTAQAVETLVPELIEQGYQIVSVSELMKIKGLSLNAGELYTNNAENKANITTDYNGNSSSEDTNSGSSNEDTLPSDSENSETDDSSDTSTDTSIDNNTTDEEQQPGDSNDFDDTPQTGDSIFVIIAAIAVVVTGVYVYKQKLRV